MILKHKWKHLKKWDRIQIICKLIIFGSLASLMTSSLMLDTFNLPLVFYILMLVFSIGMCIDTLRNLSIRW